MYFMRIICGSKRPGKVITPICLIIFMYIGDNFETYKVNHVSKICYFSSHVVLIEFLV